MRDFVQVAEKVYSNRETEEENEQRKKEKQASLKDALGNYSNGI